MSAYLKTIDTNNIVSIDVMFKQNPNWNERIYGPIDLRFTTHNNEEFVTIIGKNTCTKAISMILRDFFDYCSLNFQ